MHGQGSYHPSSGQVPQTPIAPPCLQLPPPPPPPHNLQPGLFQPQPGLIGSQNGPISPYSSVNVANAKQHLQHSSYLAPGSHPPSWLGPHPEMMQSSLPPKGLSCPPPPLQGQVLHRPSLHQLPQQQGGVQGLQQIPPPPPQMPLMVFPPPPAVSSQPLVPPSPALPNSQMLSLSASVSKLSGNKLGTLGFVDEVIPIKQGGHHSPVCAGSLYVKGGSLNELSCKLDEGKTCSPPRVSGIAPSMQPSQLMGAAQSHSLSDSDMEMEDDITQSDNDQASNHPIDRLIKSIGFGGEFEVKEQFHALQGSSQSDAATVVLPEKVTFSGSLGPGDGEQGSKLISCHNQLTNGRSASEVHSPAINSTRAAECPLTTDGDYSSTLLADEDSSSRAVAVSGEIIKGSNPFNLLQGYASENSSENNEEPCLKYDIPKTVSSFDGSDIPHDAGFNLETGTGSKSSNKSNEGFGLLSESSISCRAKVVSSDTQRESNKAVSEPTSDHVGSTHGHQTSIHYVASPKGFLKEVPSTGACTNVSSGKHHKDDDDRTSNFATNTQKIDEFGRLVREDASDSDTDDSRYAVRHNRRRKSRSYSRSRSPRDRRRRRRRSPRMRRRRRENRSRSRSWSPRRRRSRSKSPSFRHAGEFSSGNLRWGRKMPDCFDFLRGRCYRGASCRYLHHDSVKSEGSRHHGRKHEDMKKISREVSNHEYEIMSQAVQPSHNMPTAAAIKEWNNVNTKDDSVSGALEPVISKEYAVDADIPHSLGEVSANVLEKIVVEERQEDCTTCVEGKFQEATKSGQPLVVDSLPSKSLSDADVLKSHEKASQDMLFSLRDSVVLQSQSGLSDEEADNSSISDSSAIKVSITSQKKLPARETFGNATASVQNRFQLAPLPTPASLLEGTSALQMTEPSRDSTLITHSGAFQSHSAASECFPSHMLPHQNTVLPPNSSWASLPPPPPPALPPYNSTVHAGMAPPVVSLQFQNTQLPPRNDFGSQMFLRHNPTDMVHYSQVGEFQHQAYQEVRKPRHPFSGSFDQANQYTQLILPSQEPSTTKMQTYLGDSVVPGEILKPSSHINPKLQQQQQQQSYGLSHTAPDNVHGPSGKISSSSRYPPDSLDSNQPSHLTDLAVSKSSHHNPYASTFEQPYSSRFSSDISGQEKNAPYASTCDHSSSLNHASVDGQAISVGSRQPIHLPNSAGDVGQIIPGSGGDQYDPLFDCIEPTSNSFKTLDYIQKWESDDSAIMLRSGGLQKPLDVQETNKKEEVGGFSKVDGISFSTSLDNEEFGETADAEVGDAENQSQSNAAVANVCEMEIDQIKSPGKSKKSESRSTKLFKVALADFVKEILKPSWRQGNMSKEAFKTIVKKTVDKVSGAIKSHQIPKSKSKIDRYIDSSQRKLTKLVMGYVDKYARG